MGPTLARNDCVSSPAWEGMGMNDQSAGMDSVRGPCRNCKGSKGPGADKEGALAPGDRILEPLDQFVRT